jgi:hypothetical protein
MTSTTASFQKQDFAHLQFPAQMRIDYVRVYQKNGLENAIGCDPPNRPTVTYINKYASLFL